MCVSQSRYFARLRKSRSNIFFAFFLNWRLNILESERFELASFKTLDLGLWIEKVKMSRVRKEKVSRSCKVSYLAFITLRKSVKADKEYLAFGK